MEKRKQWFTVVAVYTDNLQSYVDHKLAENAKEAERLARRGKDGFCFVVLAVFPGVIYEAEGFQPT